MAEPGADPLPTAPAAVAAAPARVAAAARALGCLLAGREHVCTGELPATTAAVQFLGPFQGRQVAWRMTLQALRAPGVDPESTLPDGAPRSFIEIAPAADGSFDLAIGLDLVAIDLPAIKKALVMVRNYKRLALGRHEWGQRSAPGG